ncbi:MAG: hypothetical protein K8S98_14895 [Planctomycetes bacterium]|nr:hypothetical protein [Planctomycetota bacterium]
MSVTAMRAHVLLLASLVLLASCRASGPREEPKLAAPALDVTTGHYAGSLVGGASPDAAVDKLDSDPEHALAFELRVEYVELDPSSGFGPASAAAKLVATLRGGEPIAATGRLTQVARLARGDEARKLDERLKAGEFGRTRELAHLATALVPGTTAAITLAASHAVPTPEDGPLTKTLRCEATRVEPPAATLALALLDLAPAPLADPRETADEAAERAPTAPRVVDELLVLEPPLADGRSALIVPSPFLDGAGTAFVVFFEARGPSGDAQAVARCLADCRDASSGSRKRAQRVDVLEARRQELASALGSLDALGRRRSSLVFLAQATGAELAGDLALAADDPTLDAYVKSLPSGADELARIVDDGSTLGIVLERGAYAFLAARGAEHPWSPELAGLLVRRAGEAGRSSGAIEDLLATAKTIADLRAALVEQNRIALEDSTLAVRVRGFDWLAARGLEPLAYDPFGSLKERRKALEDAEAGQ